jgi:hypothetical protein
MKKLMAEHIPAQNIPALIEVAIFLFIIHPPSQAAQHYFLYSFYSLSKNDPPDPLTLIKGDTMLFSTRYIVLDNIIQNLLNLTFNYPRRFLQPSLLMISVYTVRFLRKPVKRKFLEGVLAIPNGRPKGQL